MGNENNRELTMAAAISEGMAQEMERDENVFVMGEDVAKYGGIFGATGGLLDRFDSIFALIIFVSIIKLLDYNFFFIV